MSKVFGKSLGVLMTSSAILAWAAIGSAQAGTPQVDEWGLPVNGVEVSDDALADMRGRYATNGAIEYFGLTFQSAVTLPDGTSLTAGISFSTNFADPGRKPTFRISLQEQTKTKQTKHPAFNLFGLSPILPRITIKPVVSLFGKSNRSSFFEFPEIGGGGYTTTTTNQSPATISYERAEGLDNTPAGLASTRGVAQFINVGGGFNDVSQDIQVSIQDSAGHVVLPTYGDGGDGTYLLDDALTFTFEDGTMATAFSTDDELGFILSLPDVGTIRQGIGNGQLLQGTNLTADATHVTQELLVDIVRSADPLNLSLNNEVLDLISGL